MSKVTAHLNCNLDLVNLAAARTVHGQEVKAPLTFWMMTEHSPLRLINLYFQIDDLETFVSVHFVRHSKFSDHFVTSNRDDRGGSEAGSENRFTLVNHGIATNAQALISMSLKRLCYMSHPRTVAAMRKIRRATGKVLPELEPYLVPECVRRRYCPEAKECDVGLPAVLSAYTDFPPWVRHLKKYGPGWGVEEK